MISDRQISCLGRLLGPIVLAVGICVLGGCSSIPGLGPETESAAFKKQVQDDRFPTAAQAMAGNLRTGTLTVQ